MSEIINMDDRLLVSLWTVYNKLPDYVAGLNFDLHGCQWTMLNLSQICHFDKGRQSLFFSDSMSNNVMIVINVASFLGNNGIPSLPYKTHKEKIVIKSGFNGFQNFEF